ncbi:hypothetical protein S231_04940 [Candidatus Phytoplasma solani]|nr:hypothetical protein S231_04940 [Candidatus Phytoplasma solani]
MNIFAPNIEEIKTCFFGFFYNIFQKLAFYRNSENNEIDKQKIETFIEKLINRITYKLFIELRKKEFLISTKNEDLLLETFCYLTENIKTIENKIQNAKNIGTFNTYLLRIVRNYFFEKIRNQKIQKNK